MGASEQQVAHLGAKKQSRAEAERLVDAEIARRERDREPAPLSASERQARILRGRQAEE